MVRTLETAKLIFNDSIPTIVLDELIEHPQGSHLCNKRKIKSHLQELYPNYSMQISETRSWDDNYESYENLDKRIKKFFDFINTRNENNIAIVTHNSFMQRALAIDKVIEHCKIYSQIF